MQVCVSIILILLYAIFALKKLNWIPIRFKYCRKSLNKFKIIPIYVIIIKLIAKTIQNPVRPFKIVISWLSSHVVLIEKITDAISKSMHDKEQSVIDVLSD